MKADARKKATKERKSLGNKQNAGHATKADLVERKKLINYAGLGHYAEVMRETWPIFSEPLHCSLCSSITCNTRKQYQAHAQMMGW
jgi:hypothetical protein